MRLIVYRMGRLCGGAHEISGIKAPIFLRGWGWWGVRWWLFPRSTNKIQFFDEISTSGKKLLI